MLEKNGLDLKAAASGCLPIGPILFTSNNVESIASFY